MVYRRPSGRLFCMESTKSGKIVFDYSINPQCLALQKLILTENRFARKTRNPVLITRKPVYPSARKQVPISRLSVLARQQRSRFCRIPFQKRKKTA